MTPKTETRGRPRNKDAEIIEFGVRIPHKLAKKIDARVKQMRWTRSAFVACAFEFWLREHP